MQTQIDLSQFTGTENYYRHPFGKALFTDGVKYFAETAGAYWFIDIVVTECASLVEREGFLTIYLKVGNGRATVEVRDGDGIALLENRIDYTDCPEGVYKFYFIHGEPTVLLVASEY